MTDLLSQLDTASTDAVPATYIIQQDSDLGWFDVSETWEFLQTAESALKRWQHDVPNRHFRIAIVEK